ncbi:MAG: ABC transporter ATP-binding protein [Candidatus Schekmanbacteria bacterium]|nr:ABC transporter ATP-binding protein [Candidatus Schekmanbacteria bacterium]
MTDKIITINNLKKRYGGDEALKGISFDVRRGEIFGLLGPNGAGKSTTINILLGLINFDSGKISILGREFPKEREYISQRMNIVAARTSLTGILTVMENLKIYAKIYNVRNHDKKIAELLEIFEISDLKNKKLQTLSAGQHTRVTLCKGLINDPEVLLLDECTMGLDPDIAEKTRRVIKFIQQEKNTTMIFTSHNMAEVEELCHRIAFVNKGEIIKTGTADELKKIIRRQTITIRAADAQHIGKVFEINGIETAEYNGETISIEIENSDGSMQMILDLLARNGIKVKDITSRGASLEDIFIKISRGEI